ncbi:MAG: hypothetical protein K2H49_09230 [Muribaculaceae bacterium]|nr:hypothetical protein [Muribaculaceae bacterium]
MNDTHMDKIKIHILHCGDVKTTRYLPFNKVHVCMPKVAGIGVPQKDWAWLPVSCYYIEHPKGIFRHLNHMRFPALLSCCQSTLSR